MKSVRMVRSKAKQGMDCCKFEMVFKCRQENVSKQPMVNKQGTKCGEISVCDNSGTLALVLPCFIRENNEKPFTLQDSDNLGFIESDCKEQLRHLLGTGIKTKGTSIETNITQKVSGNARPSDVLNLISHACMSNNSDNVKYVGPSKKNRLKEETHTVIAKRQKQYIVKAYDKSEQLQKELRNEHKPTDSVPSGLLRIELIFIERTLKRLFGNELKLSDILSEDALNKLLQEYKRVFCNEVIPKIETYWDSCVSELVESLCETENPIATIAKHRELIPDKEVLHEALRQYQRLRGKSNHNLARDVRRYASQFDLPQDVMLTIRDFEKSCG